MSVVSAKFQTSLCSVICVLSLLGLGHAIFQRPLESFNLIVSVHRCWSVHMDGCDVFAFAVTSGEHRTPSCG